MNYFKIGKNANSNKKGVQKEFTIMGLIKIGLATMCGWPGYTDLKVYYILISLIILSLVFQFLGAVNAYSHLDNLLTNLEVTVGVLASAMRIAALQVKYRSIKYVIEDLTQSWVNFKGVLQYQMLKKTNKLSNQLVNMVAGFYNGLSTTYVLIPLLTYKTGTVEDRTFMLPAKFPIDNVKETPTFEILFIFQFIVTMISVQGNVVVDALLITSVLHARTKVFFICHEISRFSKICRYNGDKRIILKAAEMLIKRHANYIEYSEYLQDIFSIVSFTLVLICTTINVGIGFIIISLLESNGNFVRVCRCLLYTFCTTLSIASYSIAGEFLTFQSNQLLEALHNCPWYEFKPTYARLILFMIIRAQKPVTLTVWKFSNLSLTYLTSVLKSTFSYLSLLRAVSK